MPVRIPRRWIPALTCLVAALSGCDPVANDRLLVATSWSDSDRRRIESDFAAWLNEHPEASSLGPIKLDWLILSPGDDLERLAARRRPPDVLLGSPTRAFERLARAKRLSPLPIDGSPMWAVARRGAIRLVSTSNENLELKPPPERSDLTFDDPRKAPISLAWAEAQVRSGNFADGYARLVRAAAHGPRIGRQAGSSSAAVERGEAEWAPEAVWDDQDSTETDVLSWLEGVAILSDARHPDRAAAFLKFLVRTGHAGSAPSHANSAPSDDHDLLADLLGATLVDAQDELWAAWTALERADSPPNPLHWMTEPPPWPPASIAKIQERQGEEAMAMVETLAGQLATDPVVRAWLVRSWLSSPRLIDLRVLEELTRAVDGRLIREPRFREWLRAEWTAWAHQRYRRVARSVRSTESRSGKPDLSPKGAVSYSSGRQPRVPRSHYGRSSSSPPAASPGNAGRGGGEGEGPVASSYLGADAPSFTISSLRDFPDRL